MNLSYALPIEFIAIDRAKVIIEPRAIFRIGERLEYINARIIDPQSIAEPIIEWEPLYINHLVNLLIAIDIAIAIIICNRRVVIYYSFQDIRYLQ